MSTSRLPIYLRPRRTPLRLVLKVLGWVLVCLFAALVVFPFVWMVLTSFKSDKDIWES